MLLCSTVVVVLRGIDRRHSSASGPLFQPSGRTHATAAAARPGGAFLAVSWAGSLGSCDGRHGRPSLSLLRLRGPMAFLEASPIGWNGKRRGESERVTFPASFPSLPTPTPKAVVG